MKPLGSWWMKWLDRQKAAELEDGIYVLMDKDTRLFLGSCHTTGSDIWLHEIFHPMVEKYNRDMAVTEMKMLCHRRLVPVYVAPR